MEELYLNGTNLWLIDMRLRSEVSELFKAINFKRENLPITTFLTEIKKTIDSIKNRVDRLKQQDIDALQPLHTANIFDATDHHGETALMRAASFGHYEITEMLLAEKANPEFKTPVGWTAPKIALSSGRKQVTYEQSKPYVSTLVAFYKGNPNLKADYPVLHAGVNWGLVEPAKLFLEAKANPNITNTINESDETALHVVAKKLYDPGLKRELVLLLLNAGALPNLTDKHNQTPLDYILDKRQLYTCTDSQEENQKIAWLLVYYSPEKIYTWERIKTLCEEVFSIFPTVLCDIIADYYPDEISPEVQALIPKEKYTIEEVQDLEDKEQKLSVPDINRSPSFLDLKYEYRFFPRISYRPLISSISGSFGLAGLLITAFTAKDVTSEKVFRSVLTLEAIFIFLMVYFSYKLSYFIKIINDQPELETDNGNSHGT